MDSRAQQCWCTSDSDASPATAVSSSSEKRCFTSRHSTFITATSEGIRKLGFRPCFLQLIGRESCIRRTCAAGTWSTSYPGDGEYRSDLHTRPGEQPCRRRRRRPGRHHVVDQNDDRVRRRRSGRRGPRQPDGPGEIRGAGPRPEARGVPRGCRGHQQRGHRRTRTQASYGGRTHRGDRIAAPSPRRRSAGRGGHQQHPPTRGQIAPPCQRDQRIREAAAEHRREVGPTVFLQREHRRPQRTVVPTERPHRGTRLDPRGQRARDIAQTSIACRTPRGVGAPATAAQQRDGQVADRRGDPPQRSHRSNRAHGLIIAETPHGVIRVVHRRGPHYPAGTTGIVSGTGSAVTAVQYWSGRPDPVPSCCTPWVSAT